MPNGTTGREGWLHRRNDTMWKIIGAVVIPTVAWLLLTTVSQGDQLSTNTSTLDRTSEDVEKTQQETAIIYRKVERIDERTISMSRSIENQGEKLDEILERLGRSHPR